MAASAVDVSDALRGLTLKDLRVQCRARGLSPAGNMDVLKQRLGEVMQLTGDLSMHAVADAQEPGDQWDTMSKNNYARPGGNQNIGNRITGRATSRVLAPPGGVSQVNLTGDSAPATAYVAGSTNSASVGAPQPTPPPSAAQRSAEAMLARMGLGDTEDLVAGPKRQVKDVSYSTASRIEDNSSSMTAASVVQIDNIIRVLPLKDLRIQCRARGLSPAGGQDQLRQRLGQHMMDTNDMRILAEDSLVDAPPPPAAAAAAAAAGAYGAATADSRDGSLSNNYSRPNGQQNMGNFLTDRPSSRVLAPPGGRSQISFG